MEIDRNLNEFPLIDQCLMKLIFDETKNRINDSKWHAWEGNLRFKGNVFKTSCEVRFKAQSFGMRNHKVELLGKIM